MGNDFVDQIFKEALGEVITKKVEDGLTDDEMEQIFQEDSLSKKYVEIVNMIAAESVKTIENIMYEKILAERAYSDEFSARQEQKWGKAFVASEAMYICILESAEAYNDYVREVYKEEESWLYMALRNIHGRALQIYLEILCLNRNGFADGAYARWRSLYELSVISAFIKKYGEEVAKGFVQSADTDDRYEWARVAMCFKDNRKKYLTFSDIQNNCELVSDEWKKEYNFVNQLVHASAQGTMYRLGNREGTAVISVGRSDWGMSISAMHSAISLSQITSDYFTVFHHGDSLAAILTFHEWVDKIATFYKEVETTCFEN